MTPSSKGCERLLNQGFLKYVKLDNNIISKLYMDISHKRALFIYTYLSYTGTSNRALKVNMVGLIELFNIGTTTRSKESIKTALSELIDLSLIGIYKDKSLSIQADLNECMKKPKDMFWVKVRRSIAEANFTLIPIDEIEDIVFSDVKEKPEDMFAVLSYICSKTERRDGVAPVMWCGMNKIGKDIHMTEKKLLSVLKSLMELEIIYFKRADMTNGRKNYVYGLFRDKEHVQNSVLIAETNNIVDKRIKASGISDNVIDVLEDDFIIDIKLSNFFDRHRIECNNGVAKETNKFYHKHGHAKLMSVLGEQNPEIHNADNKNGAYRVILRRNY